MTWPTQITIDETFTNPDGTPARGVIQLALSTDMVNPGVGIVAASLIVSTLDATGVPQNREENGPLVVDATNDPETTPLGVTYLVIERIEDAPIRSYSIVVPYTAPTGTVQLSSLVPVATGTPPVFYLINPGGGAPTDVLTQDPTAPLGYAWEPSTGGGGGGFGRRATILLATFPLTAFLFVTTDWEAPGLAAFVAWTPSTGNVFFQGSARFDAGPEPYTLSNAIGFSQVCPNPTLTLIDDPADMKPLSVTPGLLAGLIGVGATSPTGRAFYLGLLDKQPTTTPTTTMEITYYKGSFGFGVTPTTTNPVLWLCTETGEPGTWVKITLSSFVIP